MARPAADLQRSAKGALRSAAPAMLMLPPATGELPESGGLILAGHAVPVKKVMEHCGHAYHDLVRRQVGLEVGSDDSTDGSEESGDGVVKKKESGENAGTRLRTMLSEGDADDLYELLNLGEKRWRATGDEIKKAFRKVSLMYHPDKVCHLGPEAMKDSETHFKSMKKAYEILSDKKRRASYDSIDDVDDTFPSEGALNDENFFKKMVPVFDLNARWSSANRVPSLGGEDAPMDEVHKFYDFWYEFKTWRDFSFDLEYDPDQAECREEKRWMDRQNQKNVKKKKLEEASRIRRMVDVAYKKDPRVRKEADEAKAVKDAVKMEKQRGREAELVAEKAAAEEKARAAEIAAAENKVERASAKKAKDSHKQLMRRARQRLRSASKDRGFVTNDELSLAVERCCGELPVAEINIVSEQVEKLATSGDEDKALTLLNAAIARAGEAQVAAEEAAEAAKPTPAAADAVTPTKSKPESAAPAEWTQDEMKRLTKALNKCPVGTVDRYQKLADFVGGGRTSDDCLAMVNAKRAKNVASSKGAPASSVPKPKVAAIGSDFERFEREKKKCVAKSKEEAVLTTAEAVAATPAKANGVPNGHANGNGKANGVANSVKSEKANGTKPPNVADFSPKQQAVLEAAMKKYPASSGANRWKLIADEVPGRSNEECEQRYLELVSFYKAKKAGTK